MKAAIYGIDDTYLYGESLSRMESILIWCIRLDNADVLWRERIGLVSGFAYVHLGSILTYGSRQCLMSNYDSKTREIVFDELGIFSRYNQMLISPSGSVMCIMENKSVRVYLVKDGLLN